MQGVYDWIKNIVFFLVLLTIVNNVIGNESYKKYVNLISGMILIIIVISPIFNLFDIEKTLDFYLDKNTFITESHNFNKELIKLEDRQTQVIVEEYKKEIIKRTGKLLENEDLYISQIHIDIDDKIDGDSFGKIEKLDVIASYIAKRESEIIEPIKKIGIDKVEIGQGEEIIPQGDSTLSEKELHIKKILSDFYNVKAENINISIEE